MDSNSQNKKDMLQGVFTRSASSYERIRYFPIFGQWLVDMAKIPAGSKVLDVATGRGAVLFPAAERVGPRGRVVGVDLAEGMARETSTEIQRRGLGHAETHQMDGEHLTFPDSSFDFLLCGFSLQFFPHLDQGLAEFHRVLKSGGRVAVTSWAKDDERWDWFEELRNKHGAGLKLGSQSLDKPEVMQNWFSMAGFVDIHVSTKELDIVYADREEWWNVQWSISGRAGLEKLSPEALEDLKADAFANAEAQKQADGFHHQLAALCTTAQKV